MEILSNIYAIVLAGGHGKRMGNVERPKQFLEIGSKPIIVHTIEKLLIHNKFEKIVVAVPKAWLSHINDVVDKYIVNDKERIVTIQGGEERYDTIMNALEYIDEQFIIDDETIILTHDSVRPFVSRRIIDENIEVAKKYGACDTVIPASDTIVESRDGEYITSIPERKNMYQGQTPQTFKGKKLKNMLEKLTYDEKEKLTDACKILTLNGEVVCLVEGDVSNIKITYPSDLRIANALIGEKEC